MTQKIEKKRTLTPQELAKLDREEFVRSHGGRKPAPWQIEKLRLYGVGVEEIQQLDYVEAHDTIAKLRKARSNRPFKQFSEYLDEIGA